MLKDVLVPQPNHPLPGRRWVSKILERAGLPQSTAYEALVARARNAIAPAASALGPRERPATKTKRGMRRTADEGGFVKKDPAERLVSEQHDRGAHIEQALRVDFPFLGDRYELPKTCQAAIATMLSREGEQLAKWRVKQMRVLEEIRRSAMPIDAAWKRQIADVSAGVKNLRKPFNVAFLAILLDALEWPDVSLCSCLLRGFPLAGDLFAQDSNIFAPKEEGEMREDYARFEKGWAELQDHDSNLKWLSECEQMLLAAGGKARQSAAGDPHGEALLKTVMLETQAQADQGFVGPPMSKAEVVQRYSQGGKFRGRVMPRFGICQGLKIHSDGTTSQKIRCIDDARIAGINEGTVIPERVLLPSFEFVGKVAGEIFRISESAPQTNLLLGAEDIRSAYRRFGNASANHSIIGVYNVDTKRVEWRAVFGLPMGCSSSPWSFCRIPAATCAIAQCWAGVVVDSYIDDFLIVDVDNAPVKERGTESIWASSAQFCLNRIHTMLGMEFEPNKHKAAAPSNVILGVEVNLQDFLSEGKVSFAPTKKRCEEILLQLRECERRGLITIMEAAAVLGRLGFILTASYRSLGRAALQPLIKRAAAKKPSRGFSGTRQLWTVAMSHMTDFLQELLSNLPPLEFCFGRYTGGKVIVYSDASFSMTRSGLGFVVIDQESRQRFVRAAVCPPWLLVIWSGADRAPWLLHDDLRDAEKQQQHINALELLALVAVVWTCGVEIFRDRQVLFFIDNTAALSAAVRGCAKSPHLAALSNTLHLSLACLKCQPWFEWVPSNANPADIPSRGCGEDEQAFYDSHDIQHWPTEMRFPSFEQLKAPKFGDVTQAHSHHNL